MSTTVERAKEIGELMLIAAKQNLLNDGDLRPVIFFIKDQNIIRIAALAGDPRNFIDSIAEMAARVEADAVMSICDSWIANLKLNRPGRPGDAMNAPNRSEAIVCSVRGEQFPTIINSWIYRRHDGKIEFEVPPSGWFETEVGVMPGAFFSVDMDKGEPS
jgi:hypothetical protein